MLTRLRDLCSLQVPAISQIDIDTPYYATAIGIGASLLLSIPAATSTA